MSGEPKKLDVGVAGAPQLPAFRFGLKQLFWWVTGVCVLVAVLVTVPPGMAPAALLFAVFVIGLHVAGTAIGTRLRDHANEVRAWEATQSGGHDDLSRGVPIAPVHGVVLPAESKSRSPLHGKERHLQRLGLWLLGGALVGGALGLVGLVAMIGGKTSPAGIAVGAVSTAVVGAWLAFVAVNSWTIFREGWRDAVEERPRDRTGKV